MSKESKPRQVEGKKTILVTGATSGIGRGLLEQLLKYNCEVRILLQHHPKIDSEWHALPRGVKLYVADISSGDASTQNALLEACAGVNVLFHLASATTSYNHKYNEIINTNVIGTENILKAYLEANPDPNFKLRLIYSSSVTVYGYKRKGEILTEESDPMPRSAYSESKYMAEQVIRAFGTANKRFCYTILRIGVIYGTHYEHNFLQIFRRIKEKRIRYIGNGENHLTLVNAIDVVDALMEAMESEKSLNKTYNVTDGVPHTQRALFKLAAELVGAEIPKRSIHPIIARIGARARGINQDQLSFIVSDRIVSIERIRKELGFKPSINIEEGAKTMAKDFLEKYNNKR